MVTHITWSNFRASLAKEIYWNLRGHRTHIRTYSEVCWCIKRQDEKEKREAVNGETIVSSCLCDDISCIVCADGYVFDVELIEINRSYQ